MTSARGRRAKATERISNIGENYLQSLYKLKEEGLRPSAGNLTDYIRRLPREEGVGTSLPSILGMLRRMAKEGLVTIMPNKEVELTVRGEVAAESIVRRHRLAERLVVDILGLDVARAHIEAHRLEHAISPELEECIQVKLGRPATNPFGRPIPGNGRPPCRARKSAWPMRKKAVSTPWTGSPRRMRNSSPISSDVG